MTLRIDLRWPLANWKSLAELGVEANFGNEWVRIGGLKGFVDGSLGSSTARMYAPYLNEPGSSGDDSEQFEKDLVGPGAAYERWTSRADADLTIYLDAALRALAAGFADDVLKAEPRGGRESRRSARR